MPLHSTAVLLLLSNVLTAAEPIDRAAVAAAAKRVTQIVAHRGASAVRPENTLASTRRAIAVGATAVEVDVRTTKDGRLVLLHDATLDRTTSGTGAVETANFADVRRLDAGSWFEARFAGQRVPTLAEGLAACKGKCDVLLDLKDEGDEFLTKVVAAVQKHGDESRTIVGVRGVEQAKRIRKALPKSRQLGLMAKPGEIEAYAAAGVETIRLWPKWLDDESLVPRVRKAGAKLHLNGTDGSRDEVLRLLAYGPDSLSSDDPARLATTLRDLGRGDDANRAHSGDWQSSDTPIGSDRAVKGGTFRVSMPFWPATLRAYGPQTNAYYNMLVQDLCFETLLRIDPHTESNSSGLASRWRISPDGRTLDFEIDRRARWADGEPVTAEDVVTTFELVRDESTVDPMYRAALKGVTSAEALEPRVVRFRCSDSDWRNLLVVSQLHVLPASVIGSIDGREYRTEFDGRLPVGSGPYELDEEATRENERLVLRRRTDYWGRDLARNRGLFNFDRIEFRLLRDTVLAEERVFDGELDFASSYTAKTWVAHADAPAVTRGWVHRRKVFTSAPRGIQGIAYNTNEPPLDDVRVREAIGLLYDREGLIEKFAHGEYVPLKSYYPGTRGENPDNEPLPFDPRRAAKLLDEAGWTKRGPDGIRTKGGRRLAFELQFRSTGMQKYYEALAEEAEEAGVEIELELLDPATQWRSLMRRDFEMASIAWGGVLAPDPRLQWHGALADKPGTNNVVGLADAEIDRVIEAYETESDAESRYALLRKLDGLLVDRHPYLLAWNLPCERFLVSARIGTPPGMLPKYAQTDWAFRGWWIDYVQEERVSKARESNTAVPIPPVEIRPKSVFHRDAG